MITSNINTVGAYISPGGATPAPTPKMTAARNGFRVNSFNIHRLLITCLMVAAKFTSDLFYSNARYAKVSNSNNDNNNSDNNANTSLAHMHPFFPVAFIHFTKTWDGFGIVAATGAASSNNNRGMIRCILGYSRIGGLCARSLFFRLALLFGLFVFLRSLVLCSHVLPSFAWVPLILN
jgi:hypothetical protein